MMLFLQWELKAAFENEKLSEKYSPVDLSVSFSIYANISASSSLDHSSSSGVFNEEDCSVLLPLICRHSKDLQRPLGESQKKVMQF